MTLQVLSTAVVKSDRSFVLGTASISNAVTGMIRYNSGSGIFEVYNGSFWQSITQTISTPTAWGWGTNANAQIGDGSTVSFSSPVAVIGGLTDWAQIGVSAAHSAATRSNGQAWCWGANESGQLGDGTTTQRSSPVSVVGGFTDWVQITSKSAHTVGLRSNGQIWSWGSNVNSTLGDGTTTNRSSPVSVVGGFTDWVQISVGGLANHTAAIRSNGQLWAWGANSNGRLGDGTTIFRSSPVSVVGGFTDWVKVATGHANTLGIRSNGQMWSFGLGTFGQLGAGSTTLSSSPVSVLGGFTDWVEVSGGQNLSGGIRANGTAWCWGAGANGQLGNGATTNRSSPVSVVGGITDWVQIASGFAHTVALRANGQVWAWGAGLYGRLGDGTTTDKSSPVSVVGGYSDWVQISVGNATNMALRAI